MEMNQPCIIDATISITPLGKTNLFNSSNCRLNHEEARSSIGYRRQCVESTSYRKLQFEQQQEQAARQPTFEELFGASGYMFSPLLRKHNSSLMMQTMQQDLAPAPSSFIKPFTPVKQMPTAISTSDMMTDEDFFSPEQNKNGFEQKFQMSVQQLNFANGQGTATTANEAPVTNNAFYIEPTRNNIFYNTSLQSPPTFNGYSSAEEKPSKTKKRAKKQLKKQESLLDKLISNSNPAPIVKVAAKNSLTKSASKQEKKCTCAKSKCMKLYCECFANGGVCGPECGCTGCCNTVDNKDQIEKVK